MRGKRGVSGVKRGISECAFLGKKCVPGHLVKWELNVSACAVKVYSDFGVFVFFRETWQNMVETW